MKITNGTEKKDYFKSIPKNSSCLTIPSNCLKSIGAIENPALFKYTKFSLIINKSLEKKTPPSISYLPSLSIKFKRSFCCDTSLTYNKKSFKDQSFEFLPFFSQHLVSQTQHI